MIHINKYNRSYFDLVLDTSKEVKTRVIERPGSWLPDAEMSQLLDDMRLVVRNSLTLQSLDYGVLSGDKERLENCIITVLYDKQSGKPIAFNALAIMNVNLRNENIEVLHLGLVMVDPNFRTKGLSWVLYGLTCMLIFIRNHMRPIWISNVTQVPAIIGKVTESFADVFPAPEESSRRSFEKLRIASQIMQHYRHVFGVGKDAEFDEEHFIIRNAYTGGSDNLKKSFEQAQQHRNNKYNEFCSSQLDYQRGDDFIQLGQFNINVAKKYLLRSVPRSSLPALVYKILFLFLSSLMLPVLYWFSSSRQMGELRPWKQKN